MDFNRRPMSRWSLQPAPQTWNSQGWKFGQDRFNALRNSVSPCDLSVFKPSRRALRCFRCGESGHTFRNCTSEKRVKSQAKLIRDAERLQQFIRRKTCENFPFASLDNSDFRKVLKQNSVSSCQVNLLAVKIKNLSQEKQKLENIIDTIKDQLKENKRLLNDKIENLTSENKTLRTKLQKSQSINKKGVSSIREADFLQGELVKLNDMIHKLYGDLNQMRNKETEYKTEICVLTTRCKELESIKTNSASTSFSNNTDQSYKRNTQHWSQNTNNRQYRGRGRRGRGKQLLLNS